MEVTAKNSTTRILLVEDHRDSRDAMAKLLRFSGYQVSTAGSVAEAIRAADGQGIDLVVCDLTLPDGNGSQLMRELRARGPMPAIAVTGHTDGSGGDGSDPVEFRDRLLKPVDLPLLLNAIENATRPPDSSFPPDPDRLPGRG